MHTALSCVWWLWCSRTRCVIYSIGVIVISLFLGWTGVNERTFIAVKPDGVQRRLVGEIVRRFEKKGFKLVGLKLVQVREVFYFT